MTTITISLADLRALIAMRSVIADAAHHPEAAAAPLDSPVFPRITRSPPWRGPHRSSTYKRERPESSWRARVGGVRVLATHARPGDDMRGIQPDAPDHELAELLGASAADVLPVGHTHTPFSCVLSDGRFVGNPGALLRDPAPGFDLVTPGTFGVLAVVSGSATFEVRRASDGALVEGTQAAPSDAFGPRAPSLSGVGASPARARTSGTGRRRR